LTCVAACFRCTRCRRKSREADPDTARHELVRQDGGGTLATSVAVYERPSRGRAMLARRKNVKLFEGESRKQHPPPGLKSILISLNLQMDWVLEKIRDIAWSSDPIILAEGFTEIERLTLVLEDRRFFLHSGFDIWCIPRMIKQAVLLRRVGGVSTIEQHLVRTILARRERTFRRKAREVLLAWILAHRKSKREILRVYLSTAYFGYRLRGCDEAARLIFHKWAKDLNAQEAAFIASMLVYPLPKSVRYSTKCAILLPVNNVESYLNEASNIAPRWTARMRRRISYGVLLRGDIK
jgi:Transglycosylase